ncbi:hypothetical protein KAV67_03315 [Candidatus Bipolaricaulota bacterium]|nr:hypothetical protein [Candidatus Bipolaricaulota bacterium]
MRQTNDQKTTRATDLALDGLFPFQATENPPSFTPPQGGNRAPQALFPKSVTALLLRSPAKQTNETLTEVDRIATFATQLDAFLTGVEEETTRTVAIHLFLQLTRDDHNVDIAKLSAQTGLSRREVKRALYALTLTGKIQRLHGKQPRRYRLTRAAQHETQANTDRHS